MKGIRNTGVLVIGLFILIALLFSCSKEEAPENPYDSIDRSGNENPPVVPDPNSITGLHKNIFFPKCANPGCHDGTFEPDFRTVESSFSTLVFHRVNKVTLDSMKIYSERVIPNNLADSWLIERLTTPTTEYMPSNSTRLSTAEIDHVKNWINAGCPDVNGILPVKPNLQPNIIGYVAVDSATSTRLDTVRVGNFPLNPFITPGNKSMRILFVATDTADGNEATDPALFVVKEIHFSTDKDNFNGASVIQATLYIPQYNAWLVEVPANLWTAGTTIYFRIHVNDGHHTDDSEFPNDLSVEYYKTLYAFYVQ
jgi:hypothetical protein